MYSRLTIVIVLAIAIPLQAYGQNHRQRTNHHATQMQTQREMKQMLGVVPRFIKKVPPASADALWRDFKGLYLTRTNIPSRYKDLIALAVGSQIPCENCVYFSRGMAMQVNRASQQEVGEAIMIASLTRKASAVLNGSAQNPTAFQDEVRRIMAHMRNQMTRGQTRQQPAMQVVDLESAYRDAERTLGMVPNFVKRYPKSAVAGFWSQLDAVQFNPSSAIPGRYKELIGLAVASQIPCKYCVQFHKEAARMMGATQSQIDEAIAIGGDVQQWSTLMTGFQANDTEFRSEARIMTRHLRSRRRMERPGQTTQKKSQKRSHKKSQKSQKRSKKATQTATQKTTRKRRSTTKRRKGAIVNRRR